jgi:hypothetical protein
VIGAIFFAVAAGGAALLAVRALLPQPIDIQGWSPRRFASDIEKKKSHATIQAEMAALNQAKINDNAACNTKISRRVRLAMWTLALAPFVGAAAAIFKVVCAACG